MNTELPYWRSLLFVPANQDRFIDGAVKRNADAYVLDLEDSVPLSEKAETRNNLQGAVRRLSSSGVEVLAKFNEKIVAVKQGNVIATAFHPELTKDISLHKSFVKLVDNQS